MPELFFIIEFIYHYMQKHYFLIVLFYAILIGFGNAQTIPDEDITPICDGESITTGAPQHSGITNLTISCNPGLPLSPYMDFYLVQILSGSTFTFLVDPIGQDDYDFGAWLNPNWDNINSTPTDRKRGSQNDPFQTNEFNLGLSMTATDLCETGGSTGIPEPGRVRYFDVVPGDEILIAIDRWSVTTQGYTISFGGDAVLDCTIVGNSYGKCDVDENNVEQFFLSDLLPDLEADFPGHVFEFYADETDAQTGTGTQVSFPLNVNYNGGAATELFARVETSAGGFVRVVQIFLYVNRIPQLLVDEVTLPVLCDDDGDGEAVFDLTQSQTLFVSTPLGHIFKYYETEADAQAGGPNIINPANAYQSGSATVYVRIETGPLDGNEAGCFDVGAIHLEVSDFDVEAQIMDIDPICDVDGNNSETIDLTENEVDLVDDPSQYTITYHTSALDAQNDLNAIVNPANYNLPIGITTIYVRIEHPTDPCFTVSQLRFEVMERPVLNVLDDVSICVDELTGDHLYDLSEFESLIIGNPADYTITYYTSLADAQVPQNPIANPTAFPIPVNSTIEIFIRVEKDGCPNIGNVEITVNSNPEVGENIEIGPICDADGDGFILVNLEDDAADLVDIPADYIISYHTSQADADSGTNPIPNPTNYSIPVNQTLTIFVRVKHSANDCFSTATITYQTVERPVLNDLDAYALCVDQTGGNYNFDLNYFNDLVTATPENYTITYHTSQSDADSGINPINPADAYPIPVNSTVTVFIRVEAAGCYDTRSVEISINSNPEVTDLPDQSFCSNQQTGSIPYDLTQYESEWTNNPADYQFTYHTSQSDADSGLNPIPNPNNYLIPLGAQTTIYVRVENPGTECFHTTILTLFPGATATLNEDLVYALCDENFDGIYLFNLNDLEADLNADPNSLEFAYYLSLNDAQNDINPIPQTQWSNYQINALPETIWVVATTVDECRSEPVSVLFEPGEDIPTLDTVIGPVEYCQEDIINLHDFEDQISTEDVVFSFHLTLSDAENNLNPIVNTTEFEPQGNMSVFVRLEQEGRCPVLAEIQFELLPTPSIELNQTSFELCPGDTFEAIATSDDPNADFVWYLGEDEIGTGSTLAITANGTYTVIVTGENGCTNEAVLTVSTPPTPVITGIEIGPDYIIVSADSGDGGGNLEYSLDGVLWQNSPQFGNLIPGEIYTVYVREDGCMKVSYDVAILAITNFVSPNGDGKNDTWEIRGIQATPEATIKLFDRYGKLFVDTNFEGNYLWNGKYLGNPVPSGDYWFILQIPSDGIIVEQKFVGHVSVRN